MVVVGVVGLQLWLHHAALGVVVLGGGGVGVADGGAHLRNGVTVAWKQVKSVPVERLEMSRSAAAAFLAYLWL